MQGMSFVQTQSMKQQMKLSPQMIMSATLMALPADTLSERIYKEVEKNPALEIVKHTTIEPAAVRMSQHYGSSSQSDEYQSFLESVPAPQETLQEHLQSQLDLLELDKNEYRIGYRIIHNLDRHGYNLEDPETLLNTDDTFDVMNKMISVVQHLDPPGTACKNIKESLLIQTQIKIENQKENEKKVPVPELVFKVLQDYFEILDKRPSSICKTLSNDGIICSIEDVETVFKFIKTLEPYPAASYSSANDTENRYISPEVVVRRLTLEEKNASENDAKFSIDFLHGNLPKIEVSSVFKELAKTANANTENGKKSQKFATESVTKAMLFIEALERRGQALQKIVTVLVHRQSEYFDKGPGHLKPLRMIDLAQECKVDESTVSRVSNGKYILCDWGLIEIKSLFSGAIQTTHPIRKKFADSSFLGSSDSKNLESAQTAVSQDAVLHTIQLIIEDYEKGGNKKKLSDQKISDILASKGIKVARRTVSKYRARLNISSSYNR